MPSSVAQGTYAANKWIVRFAEFRLYSRLARRVPRGGRSHDAVA